MLPFCGAFDQDMFVDFNVWTKAENYLLVERLSSSTQEEEWQEIASQMDMSPSYELEAYRCKAKRKFAARHGKPYESVSLKEVEESDLGLQGYAEMVITVPGIEVVEDDKDPKDQSTTRKPSKRKHDEQQQETDQDEKDPKKPATENGEKKPKPKAKAKAKAEASAKDAETGARNIVLHIQRATQTVERLQEALAEEPWAEPLLKEFNTLQAQLKEQLAPKGGDSIQEFVSELKICVFSGNGASGLKSLKKQYRDRYVPNLALFADRCKGAAKQRLG